MTCPESDEEPSFLQILYHSITTKVVAINIQELETVIQDVSLHHSSITSETLFPISASHSIILCKNGCKIGKTGRFSLSGTVL